MSTNPKIFIKRLIEKLNDKDLIIEQQKSFIQQQDKMLELAVTQIIDSSGVCPLNCDTRCYSLVVVKQLPDCWRKYLQSEVEK